MSARGAWSRADSVLTHVGVGDQDARCQHGEYGCPGPDAGVGELPCLDCLAAGGGK